MDEELIIFLNERAVFLEKIRTKALKLNQIHSVVKVLKKILKVILTILVIINFIVPILIPLILILGIIYFLLFLIKDPKYAFESKVKNDVLPTIFKKFNPNFSYFSSGYNDKALKESEFLTKGFFANVIRIAGEDYVKGVIENVAVEFFEIKFTKEAVNYKKTFAGCLMWMPLLIIKAILNRDSESIELESSKDLTYFSGFFMYADFHKEFIGKVIMFPKKIDGLKEKIHEIFDSTSLVKINLENPYINDNYNIYTSDPQIGYYVLSQSLIDRIHILSEKEKALPIISFIQGKMYFFIPWTKNLFKVNLFTKIENEHYFLPYINEINSFEKIVKDLNLDKRIWSKT